MEESKKVVLTYQGLFFGMQTLGKLLHNPAGDKHGYWINKLFKKIQSIQKKTGPAVQKWLDDLTEEYGVKDEKGKVIMENGIPKVAPENREAYEDKREKYLETKVELDFDRLPVSYFAHIQKTPMDWELISQISDASPATLDEFEKSKNHAHEALRAIQGGQDQGA